jgi:PKD repeat protein
MSHLCTTKKNKMKKTNTFKKIMSALIICVGLNTIALAQCNASFTYTVNAGTLTATSTSTGTNVATRLDWSVSNVWNNQSNVFSPSWVLYNGTYTVTLALSDSTGCASNSSQTVTVSGGANAPACNTSFTYSLGATGLVDFTNTSPVDPNGNTTYSWDFGDYGYSSSNSPSHTYVYNGTYTVTLSVTNPYTACSVSSTQIITISNTQTAPSCNATMTYTTGASGAVSFSSYYSGSSLSTTYYWDFGYANNYATTTNSTFTYPYNGTYTVTLYVADSANSCNSNSTGIVTITNASTMPCTPTVSFVMAEDSLHPGTGVWNLYADYSWQITSAVWSWGDGTTTSGMNATHTYTAAGWYNICVTAYSSCGDTVTVCQNDSLYRMGHNANANSIISITVINTSTGIKTNISDAAIKLYPNPVTDNLILQVNTNTGNTITYSLYDVYGKVIVNQKTKLVSGENQFQINTSELSAGVYFVRIVNENTKNANTFKIIK